jgi:hypothetical protein
MIGAFSQTAKQAGITPAAIDAAMEKAAKMPLSKVPTFLDTYASALASSGMGTPVEPKSIETTARQAGEQAMGRAIDTLYPQLRTADANPLRSKMVTADEAAASCRAGALPAGKRHAGHPSPSRCRRSARRTTGRW